MSTPPPFGAWTVVCLGGNEVSVHANAEHGRITVTIHDGALAVARLDAQGAEALVAGLEAALDYVRRNGHSS